MPLHRLAMAGQWHWYLLHDRRPLDRHLRLEHPEAMQPLEDVGSSRFYLDAHGTRLFKIVTDKYDWRRRPMKWLLRDLLEKRLSGRFAGYREYRSNRIIRRAGLKAVECHAYGVAINPFNALGSVYVMDYRRDAVSGEPFFLAQGESGRLALLKRMCDEALQLIEHGYAHRDFHYGNVMVDGDGGLIWIDTHVRKLPADPQRRRACVEAMLSPTKLKGEAYRRWALEYLEARLV
ncbi:hypothetical protein [Modicisalibacter coralii]|uniref:hypothetical protein n=1 Tax=Modicisalibacter coralii TaxID=2304602 RepID=UPI001396A07F|nr:hypothetical protein [Halomonas coralii]